MAFNSLRVTLTRHPGRTADNLRNNPAKQRLAVAASFGRIVRLAKAALPGNNNALQRSTWKANAPEQVRSYSAFIRCDEINFKD